MHRYPATQRGFALLIALMFLIIVTLLSVSAMRSSTMELRMSGNEQEYHIGFDSTVSAVNTLTTSNQLAVTNPGDTTCFGFGSTPQCNLAVANTNLGANVGADTNNFVKAYLNNIGQCPRGVGNTARQGNSNQNGSGGKCAYFDFESTYDATANRGSRVETQAGYVMLVN